MDDKQPYVDPIMLWGLPEHRRPRTPEISTLKLILAPRWKDHFLRCQSPIEKLLLCAMASRFSWSPTPDFGTYHVDTQTPIGPYFADFTVVSKGQRTGRILTLAIECDGRDYHTDWARDQRRDDFIKARGIGVKRFLGTSIHHDAETCVDTIEQMFGVL